MQTKRVLLYLLPLTLFFGLTILLYSGLGQDPTLLESQLVGQKIPEFSKKLLMNPEQTITDKDIKGPALLNVWASWCPSCYHEHPFFMKLSKDKSIRIYGVNYKDKTEDALKYIRDQGNPYKKIIVDDNGRLGIDLGVYGAPETFVIDKNNQIIYRHVGVLNQQIWDQVIKPKLFAEKGATNEK